MLNNDRKVGRGVEREGTNTVCGHFASSVMRSEPFH